MKINLMNPYDLEDEWTEESPWDIINCLKCNQAVKVPSIVYDVWTTLNIGCPFCIIKARGE